MATSSDVPDSLPALDSIADDDLRSRVVAVWTRALEDSTYDTLEQVPWWPPLETAFDSEVTLLSHVEDVVTCTGALVDVAGDRFAADVDRDVAIAGALLHDVSKLYELSGSETTELEVWLPHPHYGVHALAAEGCSLHLQHIVLSHSGTTAVEPRTLEAAIVAMADRFSVDGLFVERTGTLSPLGDG